MSRYRKVDPRIWNDAKFSGLSDEAKLLFFMLLTHPSMTALGAMRGTLPGLAAEIGWSAEGFLKAFQEVSEKGMAEHDERACLVALPKFLKYNPPESPNVVKAWAAAVDMLPECELKNRVIARAKSFAEGMSEGFAKALPEAFAEDMPESGTGAGAGAGSNSSAGADKYPQAFEQAYAALPKRTPSHNKKAAYSQWTARVKQGATHEQLRAGAERYAKYAKASGKEGTEFVMMAATFFGPKDHFLQPWECPEGDSDYNDLELAV